MVETETLELKKDEALSNVACFVLLEDDGFASKPSYLLDLLGKPEFEWVTRVCPTLPVTIETKPEINVLEVIKPYLKNKEFTLVLYNNTPLLSRKTINQILEYMSSTEINVLRLYRGFVFRTDYIKNVDEIFAPQIYEYAQEEFKQIKSLEDFNEVRNFLKNQIFLFHENNGVEFIDKNSTYIESEVRIASGAVVYPRVTLSGLTNVGAGAIISAGAKIENSKIGENSHIGDSKIYNSIIKNNCTICDGAVVEKNSFVGQDCFVGENSVLIETSLAQNVKVGALCATKYTKIYKNCEIGDLCFIDGTIDENSRVLESTCVGGGCNISAGVVIKQNSKIPNGTKIESEKEE